MVSDEVTEGNIEKVLVLADRLFFRRCAALDDPKDSGKGCSPTVLEKLIVNGRVHGAGERTVAQGAGDFWIADSQAGILYVPTAKALIKYVFAKGNPDNLYDRPTRFVFPWGASLLLGSALAAERIPPPAAGAPAASPPGLGDRFANLCAFEPNAQLSAKFSGADAFDWYIEPFGTPILIGGKLLLTANPPPQDPTLPAPDQGSLQICAASCDKEDSWNRTATITGGSGWVTPQTFDYTLRSRQTGDKSEPWHGRIFFVSQEALWGFLGGFAAVAAGIVLVWLAGGGESPAIVAVRRLLFQTLPASGKLAYVNIPLGILLFFDVGVWWFLRPVLRNLSGNETSKTGVDKAVADATRKDGLDDAYIVAYDLPRDEAKERSVAVCRIIATASLTNDGAWRLPLIVPLSEFPDGDVKKALEQLLQRFNLKNTIFVDRIIDSRRIVYLFTGADDLKDKAPWSALLQYAHSQRSRSVIVTNNTLQFEKSALFKTVFRAELSPPTETQDLK